MIGHPANCIASVGRQGDPGRGRGRHLDEGRVVWRGPASRKSGRTLKELKILFREMANCLNLPDGRWTVNNLTSGGDFIFTFPLGKSGERFQLAQAEDGVQAPMFYEIKKQKTKEIKATHLWHSLMGSTERVGPTPRGDHEANVFHVGVTGLRDGLRKIGRIPEDRGVFQVWSERHQGAVSCNIQRGHLKRFRLGRSSVGILNSGLRARDEIRLYLTFDHAEDSPQVKAKLREFWKEIAKRTKPPVYGIRAEDEGVSSPGHPPDSDLYVRILDILMDKGLDAAALAITPNYPVRPKHRQKLYGVERHI
ncbi:hypothetical protein AAG570_005974 [Ranatra chinensis]|uniref:Uncharacterized protein n=1 Tax=Ranatra chinensis TaxID=642074 RepID=A0ABD0YF51_9HEMI